jgi:Ala-tRNA(Pro) deacylase
VKSSLGLIAQHMVKDKNSVESWLQHNNIEYKTVDHDPTPSMDEMLEKVKFEEKPFSSAKFAKNLFLWDKKKKDRLWLLCAAHDTQIDMKLLNAVCGASSGQIRTASEEVMKKILGCVPGSVCLFSILNDKQNEVQLIIDKALLDVPYVAFHPMINTHTTAFKSTDMLKIAE